METIANEQEGGSGMDEQAQPALGKLIEPGVTARAIAAQAGDPYDVTIRCAPRYTGITDELVVRRSWGPAARKLAEAGRHRALVSAARGGSKARLRTEVQDEIRRIWLNEADPAGMTVQAAADLLGISRAQLYSILGDQVGGKGLRSTEPAGWARKAAGGDKAS